MNFITNIIEYQHQFLNINYSLIDIVDIAISKMEIQYVLKIIVSANLKGVWNLFIANRLSDKRKSKTAAQILKYAFLLLIK